MKSNHCLLFILITTFGLLGCSDDTDTIAPENLTITLHDASQITETSFTVNWTLGRTSDVLAIAVQVTEEEDFTENIITVPVASVTQRSQLIDGLTGVTDYRYRLKVMLDNGTTQFSDEEVVSTFYYSESVTLTTSDGLSIDADLFYLQSSTEIGPGLIFMTHFDRVSNLWKNHPLVRKLIGKGYACLTFDYRGYGASDDWIWPSDCAGADDLFSYLKKDLQAAIAFMQSHEKVDASRIGLVGGSGGANMSLIGNSEAGIAVSVALTPSRYGVSPSQPIHNVMLVVGEYDITSACGGFSYKDEAEELYAVAEEPKKLMIVPRTELHGWELLDVDGVMTEVLDWIDVRCGD